MPVFGAWFGWKLARSGERPGSLGRALGLTILALAILPASGFVAGRLGVEQRSMTTLAIFAVVSVAGLLVALLAWPALGRVLLAYGLAARIPVVLVMLVAILANWGTHYDVPPSAEFPQMAPLAKWFVIGVLPQMTVWLWFTVVIGGLAGIVAGAIARR